VIETLLVDDVHIPSQRSRALTRKEIVEALNEPLDPIEAAAYNRNLLSEVVDTSAPAEGMAFDIPTYDAEGFLINDLGERI
jgi:hypothetical protein